MGRRLKKAGRAFRNPNWWRTFWVGAVLCFAFQACLHDAKLREADEWHSVRRVAHFIPVPLTYQAFDYSCGVAALQSILYYYGKEFRHDELAKVLEPDPLNGTNYQKMVDFVRSLGFRVEVRTQMLLDELKKVIDNRKPVLVLIQAWPDSPVQWSESWGEGHYAVAVGYDEKYIYFMDPSTLGHYTFIPIPEFLERWHDMDGQAKLVHFSLVITREGSAIYNPDIVKPLD